MRSSPGAPRADETEAERRNTERLRAVRIEQLKGLIATGQYRVAAHDVADAIIAFHDLTSELDTAEQG